MTYNSPNFDLMTKVEAVHFLKTGELPDNFRQRLENFVEFYTCTNCDGVKDMKFVLRDWWSMDDGPNWCPFCMTDEDIVQQEASEIAEVDEIIDRGVEERRSMAESSEKDRRLTDEDRPSALSRSAKKEADRHRDGMYAMIEDDEKGTL